MSRIATSLAAVLMATAMLSQPVLAQSSTPSTTEKIKTMTKEQWSKLRKEWQKDKAKFTACNNKSKADKLKGRKRWAAIYECMMQ
jgi:pantothenate kinase type III